MSLQAYLESPVQIGDYVEVLGLGRMDKTLWGRSCKVIKVDSDNHIWVNDNGEKRQIPEGRYRKSEQYFGVNPFIEKSWQAKIQSRPIDLGTLLHNAGYDKRKKEFKHETFGAVLVPEVNWNPTININGEYKPYQRNFVWSLANKQHLITSIYKGIEIGKFVIRERSWDYVQQQVNQGNTNIAFKDLVDGKQRLSTLIEFVESKFPDNKGNFYKDFSLASQRNFMSFMGLTYITIGSMDKDCSDEDVLDMFLNVNLAGVKIDEDHIKYVEYLKQQLESTNEC